ncbi:MAG: hypothetical protein JNK75_12490 [Betaproteobacteria bacterium]|nr:hypothetical protein [Betaproteobacteria bacterium]
MSPARNRKPILKLVLALVTSIAAHGIAWSGDFSASINISDRAQAGETGIRAYPGSVQVPGKGDDPDGAHVQFAFGGFGLKVVAVKLKSEDDKDKVAAFYRSELSRFGTVLDCSQAGTGERSRRDKKSREITCEGERAKRNGFLFKAGMKNNQRVVSIESSGDGSTISLVHVEVRGID